MGEGYSHAHAACLAANLPRGARCRVADNPKEAWDERTWILWHIEHHINLVRWSLVKYQGEEQPKPLPYPGQKDDRAAAAARFEVNKAAVDAAFGMNGGDDGN
jgi:hypothetical protein